MTTCTISKAIERALADGDLVPWYQPQVELATGRVVGAEALVRWDHPTRGILSAAAVVPIAEQSELICDVGREMLMRACLDASMMDAGQTVAVNVSARQLECKGFAYDVAEALGRASLAPARLEIELTETVLCRDTPAVRASLAGLRDMGVVLAIDDYGTGYATLEYLARLRPGVMKIARETIGRVPGVAESGCLSMLREARGHSLRVVAEGVETLATDAWLIEHGVERAQGYLYAHPMPFVEYQSSIMCGSRSKATA